MEIWNRIFYFYATIAQSMEFHCIKTMIRILIGIFFSLSLYSFVIQSIGFYFFISSGLNLYEFHVVNRFKVSWNWRKSNQFSIWQQQKLFSTLLMQIIGKLKWKTEAIKLKYEMERGNPVWLSVFPFSMALTLQYTCRAIQIVKFNSTIVFVFGCGKK